MKWEPSFEKTKTDPTSIIAYVLRIVTKEIKQFPSVAITKTEKQPTLIKK